MLVCLPSAEDTPSWRTINPSFQTDAGTAPAQVQPSHTSLVPLQPGIHSFKKESCCICNVRTMYRKSRRPWGHRTWPLPHRACENHSGRFHVISSFLIFFSGEPGEAVTCALGAWWLVDTWCGLTCLSWWGLPRALVWPESLCAVPFPLTFPGNVEISGTY